MEKGVEHAVAMLVAVLVVLLSSICAAQCGKAPAMFIFGDSLIDNGNNNFIPSIAKANYEPYGIDFGMPTGRFCNGMTVTDYGGEGGRWSRWWETLVLFLMAFGFLCVGAAKALGLPFPVAYLSLASRTAKILQGINYASAAAGILDATGTHYGARVTFNGQIALFQKTVRVELPSLIRNPLALARYLADSVFIINIGSNDYINNYLLPNLYTTSRAYPPDAFADLLITNFAQQLTKLYRIGARKMVLVGIGPLGCIPSQLALGNSTDGSCLDRVNKLVSAFNQRLTPLSARLNASLPGSIFVFQNIYDTFMDMVLDPSKYGFGIVNQACCGNGKFGGAISCLPLQRPCNARDRFIFWDSFHPTQAANAVIAGRCYSGSAPDCYPISVYQLAQI